MTRPDRHIDELVGARVHGGWRRPRRSTVAWNVDAFLGPLDAVDSLSDVSAQRSRIALGALMVAVMAAAIALIPAMMFPVLKEHNEALALGYVVTRTVEVVLLLPAAIGPLVLLGVSSEHSTGVQNVQFETLRALLLTYDEWGPALSAVFSA